MTFNRPLAQPLEVINKLIIKAVGCQKRQALAFVILNDTIEVIRYDRALLWDLDGPTPHLIGISGQATINQYSEIHKKWVELVKHLKDPSQPQVLQPDSFSDKQPLWAELQTATRSETLWLPIIIEGKAVLGLWLEKWNVEQMQVPSRELLNLLVNHLAPGYAAAWSKFRQRRYKGETRVIRPYVIFGLAALLALILIRVPLRVVAPCEIVPINPTVVTAPLDGIIDKVVVQPGQIITKDQLLAVYDKEVPLQELKVAQKQVQVAESELNRSMTLGISDARSLADLSILKLKLEKEKLNLELAEYRTGKLTILSPENGVAMLDNPDQWEGRPVRAGEKILTVSDPGKSKVHIWIPENDNVAIDAQRPVKILLNVMPQHALEAKLRYIANETTISDKGVPSFLADAEWSEDPGPEAKLGLKGTAILYGEKVSLIYYLIRKPWGALRTSLGI